MDVIISERHLKIIREEIEIENNDDNVSDDFNNFEHYVWFDVPSGIPQGYFKQAMSETMKMLSNKYNLKRVIVRNEGEIVGFLIYSYTTKNKEGLKKDKDKTQYPVILSVAIHPDYRNQKLFHKMMEIGKITTPFLVHVNNQISPMGLWNKLGCKSIYDHPFPMTGNSVCQCQ